MDLVKFFEKMETQAKAQAKVDILDADALFDDSNEEMATFLNGNTNEIEFWLPIELRFPEEQLGIISAMYTKQRIGEWAVKDIVIKNDFLIVRIEK